MSFAWPYCFLLFLPLCVAAWRMLRRGRRCGVKFAPVRRLPLRTAGWRAKLANLTPWMFLAGAALLVVACARPRKALNRESRNVDAIAIAMTVDVSGSMEALDLQLARILAVVDKLGGVALITADHGNADEMYEIDKWILSKFNDLVKVSRKAYDDFEFHIVYHEINNFCTINLSKLYVDITKDRVYTGKQDGFARRSAQSAMYIVLNGLTKLVSPLIAFTGEEIWQAMPHASSDKKESVFLNDMPAYTEAYNFADITDMWDKQFELRDDIMKALEIARAEKLIGKSLDAKVTIYVENAETYELLKKFEDELATVYIVSGVKLVNGKAEGNAFAETESGIAVLVEQADGHKCDRCWAYSTEGDETEDGGFICAKCKAVIED